MESSRSLGHLLSQFCIQADRVNRISVAGSGLADELSINTQIKSSNQRVSNKTIWMANLEVLERISRDEKQRDTRLASWCGVLDSDSAYAGCAIQAIPFELQGTTCTVRFTSPAFSRIHPVEACSPTARGKERERERERESHKKHAGTNQSNIERIKGN